jgi:hypothetical protein
MTVSKKVSAFPTLRSDTELLLEQLFLPQLLPGKRGVKRG